MDEEGTHVRLKEHLRVLIDPKVAAHRGHIIKNTGDGFLAEFNRRFNLHQGFSGCGGQFIVAQSEADSEADLHPQFERGYGLPGGEAGQQILDVAGKIRFIVRWSFAS